MSFWKLVLRSLRFRFRTHFGVVLGAAVGSAALVGALVVGDSVRETLRERALERLGGAESALRSGDRFFEDSLGDRLQRSYPFVSAHAKPLGTTKASATLLVP